MVATIAQIIGKVNPELYAENGKELLKEYGSIDKIPAEKVKAKAISYSTKGGELKIDKEGFEATHTIVYDSSSEIIEPLYFFVLDLMNDFGLKPEKLIDNFSSTPGGAHFSEIGMKATRMQEEASKMLGTVNTVLRSVLNLVYDLKEFKMRLHYYDDLKSDSKETKQAATLALKQIWMDRVDIQKGNSSIKAMALGQAGFQTLLDAFLYVKDEKQVNDIDLNDRVKRILQQRILEFNIWLEQSEKELRKRYEIEKTYLKSQVNSLKLYSRWIKPYLKNAQILEMADRGRNPNAVNMFNTLILELTLLGKSKIDIKDAAIAGDLPKDFHKLKTKRDYYSCILVDFVFRAVPRQGTFTGKTEITFRGYALNQDEIDKLNKELEKSDIADALSLIEGSTTESLDQLKDEIEEFLKEPTKEEKQEQMKKDKTKDESNPFLALIGYYDKKDKTKNKENKKDSKEKDEDKEIKKDDWIEKNHIRKLAAEGAADKAFTLFDIYKKAHGMVSYT